MTALLKLIAIVLGLSSALPVSAQAFKPLNPFFFKVQKNGHTGYILGTYHFATVQELPGSVLEALSKSPVFVSERDFESRQGSVAPSPAQPSLSPAPTAATLAKLVERGLPRESILQMPTQGLCLSYLFWESYQTLIRAGGTLDNNLAKLAQAQKKQLLNLERSETSIVRKKSELSVQRACDINALVEKLTPLQARAIQDRAMANFRSGDLRLITPADRSSIAAVAERNQLWLPVIEQALAQNAFIAVGAGHLGGPLGLLQLLAAEGYEITR